MKQKDDSLEGHWKDKHLLDIYIYNIHTFEILISIDSHEHRYIEMYIETGFVVIVSRCK